MKKSPYITATLVAIALLCVSHETMVPVWAQDGTAPPPSTVVKNRSPIELTPIEVKLPVAQESVLSNGSHVFIIEDHRTALVTFTISVRAGSFFDATDKRGAADLVADTLLEGTKSYTADQIANLADKYGASFGARSGDERTTVTLSCLAENASELLPVLAELVYEPTFPADRVKKVQFRSSAGAMARLTDPNLLAGDALRAALYGADTVYGRPSVKADQMNAITGDDLKAFHAKYFRPDTAIIGVAGDIKPKEVIASLQKFLGKQANPAGVVAELPSAQFVTSTMTPAPIIIDRPGSAQTVLNFGVPAIPRSNPDYFPFLIANRVLGGGFNSRLNQKLREEKGYTYGARSTFAASKWPGIWSATASVRNKVTGDAAKDFMGEFTKLETTPPKEGELALVKQALIGGFALTLESSEAVLARSIERYEYGLPADYWNTYADKVRAVTPADVVRIARKYLGVSGDPNTASHPKVWAVAVGEKSAIESGVNEAIQ